MARRLVPFVLLTLVAIACGGAADEPTTPTVPGVPSTTVEPTGPTGADPPVTSTTAAADTSTSGRPVAPDFTLELGDGGSFSLSEGEKPVYLVFWAEW